MKNPSVGFHLLRVGLGITFLSVGVLILRHPDAWGGLLQPWAAGLLPVPLAQAMVATGLLDAAVGLFLLAGIGVWVAALVGMLHLFVVLLTVGVNDVTVRDVGLLMASAALLWQDLADRGVRPFVEQR